jgi:hypothetical protein
VDYNTPNPGETFNLRVVQEEGGREVASEVFTNLSMDPASARSAPSFVTQSSSLVDLELAAGFDPNAGSFSGFSEARAPLGDDDAAVQSTFNGLINPGGSTPRRHSFEISVDGSAWALVNLSTLAAVPATAAAIATELQTRINAALAALVPARQRTPPAPTTPRCACAALRPATSPPRSCSASTVAASSSPGAATSVRPRPERCCVSRTARAAWVRWTRSRAPSSRG